MTPKRVEEDWSFFNRAVREKAESGLRSEAAPLKLVTPEPPPVPSKPTPLSVQPPPASIAAPARSTRLQPSNVRRVSDTLIELPLGIIAVVVLVGLIEAASRDAHSTSPAALGTSGTATMGGTEKVATDYTTLSTVVFRSWKVVTGWKFADGRTVHPDRRYCHLEALTTGGQQVYSIEERAPVERHDMPEALIPGLGKAAWDEAATKCVWHR